MIHVDRLVDMQSLCDRQISINEEMDDISKELSTMPIMPKDIDRWINSMSGNNDRFKLSDFSRIFEISRKYNSVVEKKNKNISELKLVIIDNILEQIDNAIGKSK